MRLLLRSPFSFPRHNFAGFLSLLSLSFCLMAPPTYADTMACESVSKQSTEIARDELEALAQSRKSPTRRSWWISAPLKVSSTLGRWLRLTDRPIRKTRDDVRWEFLGIDPARGPSRAVILSSREEIARDQFQFRLCRMSLAEAMQILDRDRPDSLLKRAGFPKDQRDSVEDQLMAGTPSEEPSNPKPNTTPSPEASSEPVIPSITPNVPSELPVDEDQKILDAYLKRQ